MSFYSFDTWVFARPDPDPQPSHLAKVQNIELRHGQLNPNEVP